MLHWFRKDGRVTKGLHTTNTLQQFFDLVGTTHNYMQVSNSYVQVLSSVLFYRLTKMLQECFDAMKIQCHLVGYIWKTCEHVHNRSSLEVGCRVHRMFRFYFPSLRKCKLAPDVQYYIMWQGHSHKTIIDFLAVANAEWTHMQKPATRAEVSVQVQQF